MAIKLDIMVSVRVFLCGTFSDLTAEREAVLSVIQSLKYETQAMELIGARPNRAIDTCLEEVRASDVLVVVIGFLYGSLVPNSDVSYTEAEYHEGYAHRKEFLIYLRDEDAIIPAKYSERNAAKLLRLERFRDLLKERHTTAKFRAVSDLSRQVGLDLKRRAEKDKRHQTAEVDSTRTLEQLLIGDLKQAAAVQQRLLPQSAPRYKHADIAAYSASSRYVGGDYYDFLTYPDGSLGIVIADVAGKSVPAALIMTGLQARMDLLAPSAVGAAELVILLNRSLTGKLGDRYVSLFFALLKSEPGDITYCNAGHEPPLIARQDGTVERLLTSGMVLGLVPDAPYEQHAVFMEEGDVLLLYTDGVSECVNEKGDGFGEDRLADTLRQNRNSRAEQIVEAIAKAVHDWTATKALSDDFTLVVVRQESKTR